ncbi:MAG: hypothetical protein E7353_03150 [Clostridiales bacterium]|nr:hypothetical protein [Clostridiales bacterium]
MKKKIFTILIILCLVLSFGTLTTPLANADSLLIEDKYYFFASPFYLHADEDITIVGKDKIYVINPDNEVSIYSQTADKAIFDNGKLIRLYNGNLFVGEDQIASAVIDFDVQNEKLAYVDTNAVYVCKNFNNTEVITITHGGFSAIALSGNGIYLKKDMNSYDDIYFCNDTTLSVDLKKEYCKKFDSLIFDTQLWGVDGNVLYDIDKNEKITVSPYANAISVYGESKYYVADGCLYKDNELILGSGQDFYFPHSVDSNANNVYTVDENGVSCYSYKNQKFVKVNFSLPKKASCIAVTTLPEVEVYYTVSSDVYLGEEIIYSAEDTIVDIVVDSANNVYYTTNNETYKNGEKIYDLGGLLAIAPSKKDVYNLYNNVVYKNGEATAINDQAIAFDVDGSGRIYMLTPSNVNAYTLDGTLENTCLHNAIAPVDIDISYENNTLGKIAVVDKIAHNIIFVDLDVYIPSFSAKDVQSDEELLRSATETTPVFSDLNRSKIVAELPTSTMVICPNFTLACNDYLAYVSVKIGTNTICGYVDKTLLSNVIEGTAPRYKTAKTLYDNVTLHTLPCGLQEFDNKFVQIIHNKDTEFNLIAKYSVFGENWYKAEYDGAIGYVNASQIQLGAYVPNIYPNTNAKLTTTTAVYDKIDGKYVEDVIFLAKDTEVEVIGVFDSNTKYTQIKYYDSEAGGTRTCYVKTDSIKYDHVTFEQQFALIAVIILSVSTIIVIFIFTKHKRKRR